MADAAFEAGRALSLDEATAEALAVGSAQPDETLDAGVAGLSARERQVAMLVGHGYTNRRIAASLIVSEATVATHVRNSLGKLQLSSRAQLAVWATRHGLLDESSFQQGSQHAFVP
jgi:non-specific serine/threonine protein kinase